MKTNNAFVWALALCTALIPQLNTHAATVTLPASAAIPVNTASNPGFEVRVAQASTNVVVANSARRAQQQINGTLRDSANNIVTNAAIPGTNPNGAYFVDTIGFEREGLSRANASNSQESEQIGMVPARIELFAADATLFSRFSFE